MLNVEMDHENHKNPRKLLNSWEAQALATLTSKGLPNSFKAVSETIHDETKDEDARRASDSILGTSLETIQNKGGGTPWDHI